ncbi:transposase [Streptomyces sp. NPDC059389]|uniref:transposase n=1 Tax=Streptomyces sp. NPDC059389 TaxID=3346818 RepID=UPI0036C524B2
MHCLDGSGFSPTLPTAFTGARTGGRALVKKGTKCRRVNVLGALSTAGPDPELVWTAVTHKIDAVMVLDFVRTRIARLPGGGERLAEPPPGQKRTRPCTIVIDNTQIHHAKLFEERREELEAIGVHLFSLPPRSPELNRIERLWRSVAYEVMPVRAYTTLDTLHTAVEQAMAGRATALPPTTTGIPKTA